MGKNHCINGVNWASLKKFARFIFGKDNVVGNRIVEGGMHDTYVIYIEREKYNSSPKAVDKFENEFLVTLKPQD